MPSNARDLKKSVKEILQNEKFEELLTENYTNKSTTESLMKTTSDLPIDVPILKPKFPSEKIPQPGSKPSKPLSTDGPILSPKLYSTVSTSFANVMMTVSSESTRVNYLDKINERLTPPMFSSGTSQKDLAFHETSTFSGLISTSTSFSSIPSGHSLLNNSNKILQTTPSSINSSTSEKHNIETSDISITDTRSADKKNVLETNMDKIYGTTIMKNVAENQQSNKSSDAKILEKQIENKFEQTVKTTGQTPESLNFQNTFSWEKQDTSTELNSDVTKNVPSTMGLLNLPELSSKVPVRSVGSKPNSSTASQNEISFNTSEPSSGITGSTLVSNITNRSTNETTMAETNKRVPLSGIDNQITNTSYLSLHKYLEPSQLNIWTDLKFWFKNIEKVKISHFLTKYFFSLLIIDFKSKNVCSTHDEYK